MSDNQEQLSTAGVGADAAAKSNAPSRTEKTEADYRKRFDVLRRRARKQLGLKDDDELGATHFVKWLVELAPNLRPATRRVYRAAVCFCLQSPLDEEDVPRNSGDRRPALAKLVDYHRSTGAEIKEPATSSHKKKRFEVEDLEKLRRRLLRRRSGYDEDLDCYLSAGMPTGLRPVEWQRARMVKRADGGLVLLVRNAKSTNGRSHGQFRRLYWTADDSQAISAISPGCGLCRKCLQVRPSMSVRLSGKPIRAHCRTDCA